MGNFKPLMQLEGKSMIENSIDSMLSGGVSTIVVVLGYRSQEVASILRSHYPELQVIITYNADFAATQMLDSVKIGIESLPECDAFFLLPGDMPAVDASTFLNLRAKMDKSNALIVFPTIEGHRKHPPLISYKCVPKIRDYTGEGGLREIWKQFDMYSVELPVNDIGCEMDADTPENFQCLIDYVRNKKEQNQSIAGQPPAK